MKKLNREQILSIKDLRAQGQTTQMIAQSLGVSSATIQYWVNRIKATGQEIPTTAKRGAKGIQL